MKIYIKTQIEKWFDQHPKIKQWGWFTILWIGGLLTVSTLSYPIKYLFRFL